MTETKFATKPWLSAYAPGVPHEIAPVTETLADMMAHSVREYDSRIALEFFGASTSYRQLGEKIQRVAGGLRTLGVGHGDRVALVLPNCPQHIIAFYAILSLGAIAVEHNPLYTQGELRRQFEDHGATVAIVWDKVAATVQSFPAAMGVNTVISVDLTKAMPWVKRLALRLPLAKVQAARAALSAGTTANGTIAWASLSQISSPNLELPVVKPEDIAVLQYTSGTTGAPKGAILTHANLRANAMQGEAWVPGLRKGHEVVYGVLPMFHSYGLTLCVTFAMSMGARLVLFPKFDEKLVLGAMKHIPATFLPAVPPLYQRLATAAAARRISLQGIRFAISGAMGLTVEIVKLWERATGGLLVEGYGMTEASPIIAGNPIGLTRRPGSVGVPFPSTEIRVVDPADPTVDLGVGAEGELLVRGPQVFQGYWNRPIETADVLLDDGWLRTGDIVRVAGDGFITIVDRLKEIIITGGFNVAPSEVEAALRSHPDVADVAVVGLPSDGGEDVVAAVVPRAGASLDAEGLRTYCRSHLTAYKVPKRIVQVDALPHSLIGKVLRREVRKTLAA
ncbi:long-chain-fatty-acid--CoA ligase [Parafrigoribacterium mesophilum]|uniref:long-chain-fatty-acid--CoA ligase n=1 Tax=Parafrigoribacterium mesophilum TaxID=433646 RepID=UPI0031FCCE05